MVAAGVPLVFDMTGRATAGVTAVCAALMLGWGVVLGRGSGFFYLAPALLLGVAAAASVRPGATRDNTPRTPVGPGGLVAR